VQNGGNVLSTREDSHQYREVSEECQRELEGYQLSIEFRTRTWFEGKHAEITLDFERKCGLINVTVDESQNVKNNTPSVWDVSRTTFRVCGT